MATPSLIAQDVAEYFLANVDRDKGDIMTNLKLQKLLYYAQGFYLAMQDGAPLFPESLLAWRHVPVVHQVYLKYRNRGRDPIDAPDRFDSQELPSDAREILTAVNSLYGQFTASRLETMTHEELPWRQTPAKHTIERDLMRAYFSTLVDAGKHKRPVSDRPMWPTDSFHHQKRRETASRLAVHGERLRSVQRRSPRECDLL